MTKQSGAPHTSCSTHTNLSMSLLRMGQPEDALRHAENAISLDPSWAKGHLCAGRAHQQLQDSPLVVASSLVQALTLAPSSQQLPLQKVLGLWRKRSFRASKQWWLIVSWPSPCPVSPPVRVHVFLAQTPVCTSMNGIVFKDLACLW